MTFTSHATSHVRLPTILQLPLILLPSPGRIHQWLAGITPDHWLPVAIPVSICATGEPFLGSVCVLSKVLHVHIGSYNIPVLKFFLCRCNYLAEPHLFMSPHASFDSSQDAGYIQWIKQMAFVRSLLLSEDICTYSIHSSQAELSQPGMYPLSTINQFFDVCFGSILQRRLWYLILFTNLAILNCAPAFGHSALSPITDWRVLFKTKRFNSPHGWLHIIKPIHFRNFTQRTYIALSIPLPVPDFFASFATYLGKNWRPTNDIISPSGWWPTPSLRNRAACSGQHAPLWIVTFRRWFFPRNLCSIWPSRILQEDAWISLQSPRMFCQIFHSEVSR